MQFFETERLIIRNFKPCDAAGLLDYLSDPRVNCFVNEKLHSLNDAIVNANERSQDDLQFAVCLKDSGALIGNLFAVKEEPDTFSVGWNFNGRYEGKGYASESAKAYLDFLFNEKDARRIYFYVEETNLRSQKLCERLGLRKEGLFLEFISFVKNADGSPRYENTFQYAILKKEWQYSEGEKKKHY